MPEYKKSGYTNIFSKLGIPEQEIEKRVADTFDAMFLGTEGVRIYHDAGDDMGYVEDTGNVDARSDGMTYRMMFCVQLDWKDIFDKIWK